METPKQDSSRFNTLRQPAALVMMGTVALVASPVLTEAEAIAKPHGTQLERTYMEGAQQVGRISLHELESIIGSPTSMQHHKKDHSHRQNNSSTSLRKHRYSPDRRHWLLQLRRCESGNNYKINTGNGYYGAYQFRKSTWDSLHTGYAYPHQAPKRVQDWAIIKNTRRAPDGLATQNPGCYHKFDLSKYPPK